MQKILILLLQELTKLHLFLCNAHCQFTKRSYLTIQSPYTHLCLIIFAHWVVQIKGLKLYFVEQNLCLLQNLQNIGLFLALFYLFYINNLQCLHVTMYIIIESLFLVLKTHSPLMKIRL